MKTIPQIGVQVVEVPASQLAEKLESYTSHPLVKYAEPNSPTFVIAFPQDPPNDPLYDISGV